METYLHFMMGVIEGSGKNNFITPENYKHSIVGFTEVNNSVFITVLDPLLNETVILNSEGVEIKGFPVEGSAGVAIGSYGRKKSFIAIAVDKNGFVNAYSIARK